MPCFEVVRPVPECQPDSLSRISFRTRRSQLIRTPLRIDSPTDKCCSRGTFLHFSLRGSRSNSCYYHQDLHSGSLHACSHHALRRRPRRPPTLCFGNSESKGAVSVARFSAIHFQGCSIRQVSCYTLLGGCRLPWPPSCCPDGPTPFVVSLSGHSGTLASRLVHPTSPVLLTKKGPLETCICRAARSCSMRPTHSEFENRSRTSCPQCL